MQTFAVHQEERRSPKMNQRRMGSLSMGSSSATGCRSFHNALCHNDALSSVESLQSDIAQDG